VTLTELACDDCGMAVTDDEPHLHKDCLPCQYLYETTVTNPLKYRVGGTSPSPSHPLNMNQLRS
jgi:hypothetical protein